MAVVERRYVERRYVERRYVARRYVARLESALRHRGLVFAATGALLAGALLLWPRIPVELAPRTDADEIDVALEMARGTNIAVAREYLEELAGKVRSVVSDDVHLFSTEVRGDNAAIELKLVPQDRRRESAAVLADRVRAATEGEIPGAEIEVEAQQGRWMLNRVFSSGGSGDALELELRGWDLDATTRRAGEIEQRLPVLPGIAGVRVSRRDGQPEPAQLRRPAVPSRPPGWTTSVQRERSIPAIGRAT